MENGNYFKPWTKDDICYLVANYSKLSGGQIADHLGRKIHDIRMKVYSLRQHGVNLPKRTSRGPGIKITKSFVDELNALIDGNA